MPYDERDDQTNRFRRTYTDEDFLEAVRELEIAGTSEVSEIVGCSTENARVRLNQLVDRGELEKRKVGKRNIYLKP